VTKVTSASVANGSTLTITITPKQMSVPYTLGSVFLNNIVGKACTVNVHSEIIDGEGVLAGNMRDSKTYAGSETYGGYIGDFVASTKTHITVLNSSGGPLAYTFVATIMGSVNISQSIA
jgi:hypothetical protein